MNKEISEKLDELNEAQKKKANDFVSIIDDMGLEEEYKDAGLIYFAVKSGRLNLNDVKEKYSKKIYNLISVLEKLDNINYSRQDEEAENIRKMFFAITKDIRTIMLKIALVVADVRNLENKTDEEVKFLTHSIFSLYAPLSARLGLSAYKTELEETAFKLDNPKLQAEIQQEVDSRFHKRQPIVERLKKLVESCMADLGIKGKVYGRKKHIYSIYKKLKDHKLDNIYDLVAVRAIVSTVPECYALLGKLHSVVEPLENRFKDYIAIPKPNGYQSLHTTVKFEGFPVEIQIRTEEMHRYAEYGVAAHWIYKEKRKNQDSLDLGLSYFRLMMDTENVSVDELANSLNEDIYGNDIFVQTPLGKVIYLPSGSTPIDFAYSIHSEVGNKCVGAKVNGKIVPTNSTLNNGDVVEILTNPNSKGPSRDWLKFCKTSTARSGINTFFKKNMKEENVRLGRTMLENAIKDKGYSTQKLMDKQILEGVINQYNMTENEFLANIGSNALNAKTIANKLASIYQKQIRLQQTEASPQTNVQLTAPAEKQINIKGLNNILVRFANCCHPMYGDKIIGFVSAGRGVIIHREICPNVSYYDENRVIEADWKPLEKPERKPKKKVDNENKKTSN